MYRRKDHYYRKAKQEGYRSRAAYKLQEIQDHWRIIRKGDCVLDLGCAPGGWMQVSARLVGPRGRVVGVDRVRMVQLPFPWVEFLRGDLTDVAFNAHLCGMLSGRVRVLTSDMAPDTTGIRFQDHVRSCELVRGALALARTVLLPGGALLAKLFQGEDAGALLEEARDVFRTAKWVVPESSRKESSEIYLLATGFQPHEPKCVPS